MTTFPRIDASLSDTVYLLVTFFLMLWFFKAAARFYRALKIREALLTDHIVSINGLGSFLEYFDGATRAHIHAIVHTRQAMPPEKMRVLYVPYVLYKNQLILNANQDTLYLKMQMACPVPSVVYVMTNFRLGAWRRHLTTLCAKQAAMSGQPSRAADKYNAPAEVDIVGVLRNHMFVGTLSGPGASQRSASANGSAHGFLMCPTLSRGEVCDQEVYMHETPGGISSVSLQLFPRGTGAGNPDVLRSWIRDLRFCAVVCPVASVGHNDMASLAVSNPLTTPASTFSRPSGVVFNITTGSLAPRDLAASASGAPSAAAVRSPERTAHPLLSADISSDSPQASSDPSAQPEDEWESAQAMAFCSQVSEETLEALYSAPQLPQPSGSDTSRAGRPTFMSAPAVRAVDVSPSDALVADARGRLFSTQEIYGLHSRSSQGAPQAAASAPAAATTEGGEWIREECVVCLTEQKCVTLLPCRHLCVCTSCLIYVDKCPVCRAFFQEYVVIQGPSTGPVPDAAAQAPAATTGADAPADGGRAVAGTGIAMRNVVGVAGGEHNV